MTVTMQRTEKDLLGYLDVPSEAYYGVHTARAIANYPISGIPISNYPDFINAFACVKQAAALTNHDLGLLDDAMTNAIVKACEEVRAGKFHDQFVVDVIQGGAGTSTNMNVNEVIANRALEHLGHARGEYQFLDPAEHVNMAQSTNDTYPTALKLALHTLLSQLVEAIDTLSNAFEAKATEFADTLKMGRTQLQDAVPMTLGQEFSSYALMLRNDEAGLHEAYKLISSINMGATAIGTGITTAPGYAEGVRHHLSILSGIELVTASNLVEATQDVGAFVQISGLLKRSAVKLSKICNDLRLLSSGPRAGLGEINLPGKAAGSSIMPGKVNPVIPEVVNQIAFEVIGNDVTITFAAEGTQLQLNAFGPIIMHKLLDGIQHLTAGCGTLTENCVNGITANHEFLRKQVEHSIGIVTALNPYIGYSNSTQIAQEALATNASVYDLVLSKGLLSKEKLDDLLRPEALAHPPKSPASLTRE